MKLKDAFEMTVEYTGQINPIKVNEEGMICLNDMSSFFPSKTMDNWLTKKSTKEFLVVIEKFLKPLDSTGLKLDDFGKRGSIPKGLESIKTKRGKYGGGTYAHELVALEFATWLSPEFKLNVQLKSKLSSSGFLRYLSMSWLISKGEKPVALISKSGTFVNSSSSAAS